LELPGFSERLSDLRRQMKRAVDFPFFEVSWSHLAAFQQCQDAGPYRIRFVISALEFSPHRQEQFIQGCSVFV
jgi:hypothetical protein